MASNIQDEENAENLLISSDTDMENELSQLFDNSIDESHLLNYEEQHSNNEGHITSDQETAQISEYPKLLPPTSNLIFIFPACHKMKVHAPITQLPRPLWIKFYNLVLLQDMFTMYHPLKMESTLIFNCK